MAFDLFSVDVLDEDVARFQSYKEACVIEDSLLGKIVLVPNETFAKNFPRVPCYTPEECRYLLSLSLGEARTVQEMKIKFGGSVRMR